MKSKILLLAALLVVMGNLSSCAVRNHHRDANTPATSRDEQDHMRDNQPR